jgi:hypothetical protein
MPRAKTKAELLENARKQRSLLLDALDSIPAPAMETALDDKWSAKDVIAHLVEWEAMVESWYASGLRGEKPAIPAQGYKWSDLPALNEVLRQRSKDKSGDAVREEWEASSRQVIELMESISEEDLFTPKRFAWTGTTTLGAYLQSCGPSHYEWARKEIRSLHKALAAI